MGDREPRGNKRPTEHRKSKADIGIPVLATDFAVIGEIPPPHASDTVFAAMGRIFSESVGLPEQAGAITKASVYRTLLGVDARNGRTVIVGDKEKHVKGHYEQHPELSKREVDDILNAAIVVLADANVASFMGALLDGTLARACNEKKGKHKK
jgi:hypothetical protein